MGRKVINSVLVFVGLGMIAVIVYLWTPTPQQFDREAALRSAMAYDARIVRDAYGVPHIFGERDADVAFGLAYAHSEDDWATIEESILFTRGDLALTTGKDGAVTDFLIDAFGVWPALDAGYADALSDQTLALLSGYVAGVNLWCAEEKDRCTPGVAPIHIKDAIAGYVARTPFFYGLNEYLTALFEGDKALVEQAEEARQAYLKMTPKTDLGSNAIAIGPTRSADKHTRLFVNSHQPFTGPVAWYEARVKSGEGWDMIGALFPGSPMLIHGATPNLGWAFTVNKPDLVDFFALEVNNEKKPTQYKMDGEWRDFDISQTSFRVKLFGPFSLPVKRPLYFTAHGPAFKTPSGFVAVSFGGDRDLRGPEQYRLMNKATNLSDWQRAMSMQAIPSLNVIYADKRGNIGYVYNAAVPNRNPDWDWQKIAPGNDSAFLWNGVLPYGTTPIIFNPAAGVILNANNSPFEASFGDDMPLGKDYPKFLGIDRRVSNRGLRLTELFKADKSVTEQEFLDYKMDTVYSEKSFLRRLIAKMIVDEKFETAEFSEAISVLAAWDGTINRNNRQAALAVVMGQQALGALLNPNDAGYPAPMPNTEEALRYAMEQLTKGFGRLDPEWGDLARLKRGKIDLPLDGGPDVLRAIYIDGDISKGSIPAVAGDTYILYADWNEKGDQKIRTIHQFGSATLDETSPHYGDQATLFAEKKYKTPPMTMEALEAEKTRDYHVGSNGKHEEAKNLTSLTE